MSRANFTSGECIECGKIGYPEALHSEGIDDAEEPVHGRTTRAGPAASGTWSPESEATHNLQHALLTLPEALAFVDSSLMACAQAASCAASLIDPFIVNRSAYDCGTAARARSSGSRAASSIREAGLHLTRICHDAVATSTDRRRLGVTRRSFRSRASPLSRRLTARPASRGTCVPRSRDIAFLQSAADLNAPTSLHARGCRRRLLRWCIAPAATVFAHLRAGLLTCGRTGQQFLLRLRALLPMRTRTNPCSLGFLMCALNQSARNRLLTERRFHRNNALSE